MTQYIVHLSSGTFFPVEEARIIDLPDGREDVLRVFEQETDAFRSQLADWFGIEIKFRATYQYPKPIQPPPRPKRNDPSEVVIASKEEALSVLRAMNAILEQHHIVSIADFNDLVGIPRTYDTDTLGWDTLEGVEVKQVRTGYSIVFPTVKTIS
jgi:hypothetical protein